MTETERLKPEASWRAVLAGRIVARLHDEAFGAGPLAGLRRLDPAGPLGEPALHRLLARCDPEEQVKGDTALRGWALVIHCLALAAPDNLGADLRLGAALQSAGFGETRFVNLLDATGEELLVRLPRAVRFLVHRGGRLHGPQLADFVLIPPDWEGHGALRRRIASDYYRSEYRAGQVEAATP